MNPLLLGPVLEIGKSIIDRLFPDAEERARKEAELLILMQTQEMQKVLAQLEVNAREATSPHMFVAGWRPFVGWCCGMGFAWAAIGQPIFAWIGVAKGWPAPPSIDSEVLLYVLGGMLGLGTLRTVEKSKSATK
ncbi:MAG: holin family protein [Sulfuricaulis sp.]|nr:holin family protein [Sulfuricaulis sp.]